MNLEAILFQSLAYAPTMRQDHDHSAPEPLTKAELLRGGEADGRPDTDFDTNDLEAGTQHELEHTTDHKVAREIAKDHLAEDSVYYRKLGRIE